MDMFDFDQRLQAVLREMPPGFRPLTAIKEPKTEASRRGVPLSPVTVTALRRCRKRQTAEQLAAGPAYARGNLVFTDETGQPSSPDRVSRGLRSVRGGGRVPAADLPRHAPHLRHDRLGRRRGRALRSRAAR